MVRKLFVSLALIWSIGSAEAIMAVHDSLSFAKAAEGLKSAGMQLQSLRSIRSEMSQFTRVLGNKNISAAFKGHGINLREIEGWGRDLNLIGRGNVLNTLNRRNRKDGNGEDYSKFIKMKRYADRKLHGVSNFSKKGSPFTRKRSTLKTQKDLNAVRATRQNYAAESSSMGQVIAAQQKQEWGQKNLKTLKKIKKEGDQQNTLLGQAIAQKKLLELIVQQNSEMAVVMAQILDCIASITAQTTPILYKANNPQTTNPTSDKSPSLSFLGKTTGAQKLKGDL